MALRNLLLATASAAFLLLPAAAANAATIDFSDLTSGSCNYVGSQAVSQGFKFSDTSGGGLFLCNAGVIQSNVTPALIAANTTSILSFSRSDGGLFSLNSLFAGSRTRAFNTSVLEPSSAATGIEVTGFNAGGSLAQIFTFTGAAFSQFVLNPGFADLSSVRITALGSVRPEFLINGIVVDQVPAVPEPATWAMMLVGFGMVGAGLRRRQRQMVRYNFG